MRHPVLLSISCPAGIAAALAGRQLQNVMDDSTIFTARDAWLANPTAAEATYGHISTWDTSGVTDMSQLFCDSPTWWSSCYNSGASSFNEDIGAGGVSGVTDMSDMFRGASSFNHRRSSFPSP